MVQASDLMFIKVNKLENRLLRRLSVMEESLEPNSDLNDSTKLHGRALKYRKDSNTFPEGLTASWNMIQ